MAAALAGVLAALAALAALTAPAPARAQIYTYQMAIGAAAATSTGTGDAGPGRYGPIGGIALDPAGAILYVADPGHARILRFSARDGHPLGVFAGAGAPLTGPGLFRQSVGPGGVAVDGAGCVYATDAQFGRVVKLDRAGRLVATFGIPGRGPGQFRSPGALAVDRAGRVYVCDFWNCRVQVLAPDGQGLKYLRELPAGRVTAPGGATDGPTGVAVDVAGNVFVAVRDGYRVVAFDRQGRPRALPRGTPDAVGLGARLDHPASVTLDPAGRTLFVAFDMGSTVLIFDARTGALTSRFGGPGTGRGRLYYPQHLTVDAKGDVYVAGGDNQAPRLQKFRRRYLLP